MNKLYEKPEMTVVSYASADVTSITLAKSAVITPTNNTKDTFTIFGLKS